MPDPQTLWRESRAWLTRDNPFGTGNDGLSWLAALSTFVLVLLLVAAAGRLGRRWSRRQPEDAVRRIPLSALGALRGWVGALIGVGTGAAWLDLPPSWSQILRGLAVVGGGLQIGMICGAALSAAMQRETVRRQGEGVAGFAALSLVRLLGQVVVWSVVLLLVLSNLGVDVTGLVASLGVGGIAVALAAQNLLGDLFASLSIILDKPFEVGDFIVVGDEVGAVQNIGLKSTRIQALSGEQIVVGNANLLSSRIRNFKRMARRRVVLRFGVLYASPSAQLKLLPDVCRAAVERQSPRATFDRAHLDAFAASSVEFEVVYYVTGNDYVVHMDIKQAILLDLFEALPDLGLELAFPTQSLHIESMPEADVTERASSGNGRLQPEA